jgi:hypothetical protein
MIEEMGSQREVWTKERMVIGKGKGWSEERAVGGKGSRKKGL